MIFTRFIHIFYTFIVLHEPFIASSGVPQGSVLSPLLFLLFINDCVNVLPPDGCLLYADDIKIFLPVSSLTYCARLQDYIDCFNVWCNSNGLILSPDTGFYKSESNVSKTISDTQDAV